jgi:hypothetical protein
MSRDMVVLPAWASVASLGALVGSGRHAAYPVVDFVGAPVGVLGLEALTPSGGPEQPLSEVCLPTGAVRVLRSDDSVDALLADADVLAGPMALVVDGAVLVGVLSIGGLLRLRRSHL